jgi:hypothetical protein
MPFKFDATNVNRIFVKRVTGVMNFKPIMRYESVIDAMPFIVAIVMKWINAMIVEKWFVRVVVHCCLASFVGEACVKNVPRPVDGTLWIDCLDDCWDDCVVVLGSHFCVFLSIYFFHQLRHCPLQSGCQICRGL